MSVTYIGPDRQRVTTETAYLTPDVLARPNLTVAVNACVTKVLFETRDEKTRAVGVECVSGPGGPRYVVQARKGVVLSCVCQWDPCPRVQWLTRDALGTAQGAFTRLRRVLLDSSTWSALSL